MSQDCEVKRIQQNSAQAAYDQSKVDYNTCLGPAAIGDAALADAKPAMDQIRQKVDTMAYMEQFILGQLKREVSATAPNIPGGLPSVLSEESERLQAEIDALKSDIRTERRKFLDASPSATTAVAGLYFTQQPDNQLLIAFLSCFGAFLLFVGLLVIMGYVPIYVLESMTVGERAKTVGIVWVLSVGLMYLGFFMFT